jgi:Flp pilus assembly protein TadG
LTRFLRAIAANAAGGTAVIFALCLPCLALAVAGAIELAQLNTDRQATQDVADATALMGAKQLGSAPVGVEQRADAYATAQLTDVAGHASVSVVTAVVNAGTVTVTIDTTRASFFGGLLPPGGFQTHVSATAVTLGSAPLCVLAIAPGSSDGVTLQSTSQIQAQCAVDSNQSVTAASGATLAALETMAGTTASGPISPAPLTGAPTIPDPFASLNIAAPASCAGYAGSTKITSDTVLQPGVHCGDYSVVGHATLTLAPGEHYFSGNLTGKGGSMIAGDDVVLIFGAASVLDLKGAANISLNGRKTGPLAGFVIAVDRAATGTFTLQTDPFTNITGAIYVPTAVLNLDGTHQAAQASQWTVVTARSLLLTGSPDLVINANYASSAVPVPAGVGPQGGGPVTLKN